MQGRRVANLDSLEEPGDFCWLRTSHSDEIGAIGLLCPACGCEHDVPVKPGNPQGWGWDGNQERPTLSPSIFFSAGHGKRNPDCRWHGFLQNGEWRSV